MAERVPMTPGGHRNLKAELKRLITEERPRAIREIEAARAHGDLSENAEYDAAKEKQGHLEGRIAQIEDRLARAQVIDSTGQEPDVVRFGATVVLRDVESAEEKIYTIVGEDESDVSSGLISVSSPVARALVGKQVDSEVQVKVPKGIREFEILAIRYE
ncbi:MAG: transcription elongation factor GreA [Myxococcota bacterium]